MTLLALFFFFEYLFLLIKNLVALCLFLFKYSSGVAPYYSNKICQFINTLVLCI